MFLWIFPLDSWLQLVLAMLLRERPGRVMYFHGYVSMQ